jgi:hypothetical protein
MTPEIRSLLLELRERVEGEDYIGTCGCVSKRPKSKPPEEYCSCLQEHNAMLAKIDAALEPSQPKSTARANG